MVPMVFGGEWTNKKLACVSKYLHAYMMIMKNNEKARYFSTTYVDAFAGTGYREIPTDNSFEFNEFNTEIEINKEIKEFYLSSICVALETEPPFDKYLFIEKRIDFINELDKLCDQYKGKNIDIRQGDANQILADWCDGLDWKKNRAVVFLDPFGMQVDWSLLEKIAQTKSIDLWLLVPWGIGLLRLLTKDKLPNSVWANKITRFLGTDKWKEVLYKKQTTLTLFGEEETIEREVDLEKIQKFFINRLQEIFFQVSKMPLVLLNSKKNPIYLLVFAVGNPKGAGPAMRISDHIISHIND